MTPDQENITAKKGLPPPLEESSQPENILQKHYDLLYQQLVNAEQSGSMDQYVEALRELSDLMANELKDSFKNAQGIPTEQRGITVFEWGNDLLLVKNPLSNSQVKLVKEGQTVSIRSNTKDNNGNLHGRGSWENDPSESQNSENCARVVTRFIGLRGHAYISGNVVDGKTKADSVRQIETTFKGFGVKN